MLVRFFVVLLYSCTLFAANAISKAHWLPDYMTGEMQKK